jgi:hypothetical protein
MNSDENGQKYGAHFVAPKPLLIKGIAIAHPHPAGYQPRRFKTQKLTVVSKSRRVATFAPLLIG